MSSQSPILMDQMSNITSIQKKQDCILFQGLLGERKIFGKALSAEREDLMAAITDEYHTMKDISHPMVPHYYGITAPFCPDGNKEYKAVISDYINGTTLLRASEDLSWREILAMVTPVIGLLGFLKDRGLVYTDLNPGNIMISPAGHLYLVDYTGAWYYRRTPSPTYRLRFSYRPDPSLPGDRLLIQETALMLEDLFDNKKEGSLLPSCVYALLETGLHPSSSLSLKDYQQMIRNCLR